MTWLRCINSFITVIVFGLVNLPVQSQCPTDLDHNGITNGFDFTMLLATWGTDGDTYGSDLNMDGIVDAIDLNLLLTSWGTCAGPVWAVVIEWVPDPNVVTDSDFRQRMATTGLPWRVRDIGTNIELLLLPPGVFTMGASPGDSEAISDEMPAHQVTLTQSFYIGKTEVTQSQWIATMGNNPSQFQGANCPTPEGCGDHPVEQLVCSPISSYCSITGFRLPTEAEWEYACRGGNTTGSQGNLDNVAWHGGNSGFKTHPVATKLPNAIGLYDTLGNAFEWTQDLFGPYSSANQTNPTGPTSGPGRSMRGGSANYTSYFCRMSARRFEVCGGFLVVSHRGVRIARTP
jgi:formylglycine-generating enzyme required for sulfatase activity